MLMFFFIIKSKRHRHQSCHTTPLQSPCTSPLVSNREIHFRNYDTGSMHSASHSYTTNSYNNSNNSQNKNSTSLTSQSTNEQDNISVSSNSSINIQIRSRINSFKNTALSTPKFLRRKLTSSEKQQSDSNVQVPTQSNPTTPNQQYQCSTKATTPTTDSKSWFQRLTFNTSSHKDNTNSNSVSSSGTNIQDKEYVHIVNDRVLNSVKADLIHAFLCVSVKNFILIINISY